MLMVIYFFAIMLPMWTLARMLTQEATTNIYPSIRSGEQHAHMLPKIYHHLKENNCENATDKFGRMNAMFYKNWTRQEPLRKHKFIEQCEKHL